MAASRGHRSTVRGGGGATAPHIKPPVVKFVPPLFHPNVYPSGTVCALWLNGEMCWRAGTTTKDVLLSVEYFIHGANNIDDPDQREPYELLKKSRKPATVRAHGWDGERDEHIQEYLDKLRASGTPVQRADGELYGAAAIPDADKILITGEADDWRANAQLGQLGPRNKSAVFIFHDNWC